jgi:hypothetical protein
LLHYEVRKEKIQNFHHVRMLRIIGTVLLFDASTRIRETWFLTLREEHRLRAFEKRGLKKTYGPERDEMKEGGGICITRSFVTRTLR